MERFSLVEKIVYLRSDIKYRRIIPNEATYQFESLILQNSYSSSLEVKIVELAKEFYFDATIDKKIDRIIEFLEYFFDFWSEDAAERFS